ncbi:FtsK/SpoIIIE domain-containing protein [Cellulomonas sp. NPDC089187]|uniref:FtsK/SpoIIIE domain-containing protein n=1 Tax=Cellulomonas sp. NPDC089187 TaxID=3154970 RepID=UPI003447B845
MERALESLGAELRYREHVLAGAGAKDLDDYIDLAARRPDLQPMPRLAIVIDEFASLARELPDFVTGLVNIAQRGRSLGIHLVLATQRPSGVVSAEIRANTNLRIALRVTDAAESADVIDAPDAARIGKSTPGRAYVRLGSTSLIPFQSGRVGGRRPSVTEETDAEPLDPLVQRLSLPELAEPAPQRPKAAADAGDVERTDLAELVSAIRGAAQSLSIPEPRKPWLPALPEQLLLSELNVSDLSDTGGPVPYGRVDLAGEQRQPDATIDLEDEASHLTIVGAARTGRTTALRTLAASFARTYPTDQLHLYAIDCGNGGLLPLRDFPHVGAVVTRTQLDETSRLLGRLRAELKRRQELLASGGFADASEQRRSVTRDQRLPRIVVLLDSWEGFTATFDSHDGGSLVDSTMTLLREGASAGIHLMLTGDRQLVSGRMGSLVDDKIALRLIDRTDYSMFGLNARKVPENIEAGRGFRAGSGAEIQIAVVSPDASGQSQREELIRLGAELRERDHGVDRSHRPFGVESMPARLSYSDLVRRAESAGLVDEFVIGVGGDDVEPIGFDPLRGPSAFVIGGPSMSGRSTALLTIVRSALDHGYEVVGLAPRTSPLRDLVGDQVRAVVTDTDLTQDVLEPLLVTTPDGPPVLLAVDDADLLRDIPADAWLRTVVPQASDRRLVVVVAGQTDVISKGFSGWLVETRKARQGVLLKPNNMIEADLIGGRLKRSDIGAEAPTGRGFIQVGSAPTASIQIAQVTPGGDA